MHHFSVIKKPASVNHCSGRPRSPSTNERSRTVTVDYGSSSRRSKDAIYLRILNGSVCTRLITNKSLAFHSGLRNNDIILRVNNVAHLPSGQPSAESFKQQASAEIANCRARNLPITFLIQSSAVQTHQSTDSTQQEDNEAGPSHRVINDKYVLLAHTSHYLQSRS